MGDYFIHNVVRQIVIRNKIYRNNYMNILGGSYAGYQKVINNLLSNAIKFTDQGNTVGIELKLKETLNDQFVIVSKI